MNEAEWVTLQCKMFHSLHIEALLCNKVGASVRLISVSLRSCEEEVM